MKFEIIFKWTQIKLIVSLCAVNDNVKVNFEL